MLVRESGARRVSTKSARSVDVHQLCAAHEWRLLARVAVTFGTRRASVTFVHGFVVAQGVVSSGLAVFNAVFALATAVQDVAKGACANARVHQVCPVSGGTGPPLTAEAVVSEHEHAQCFGRPKVRQGAVEVVVGNV